MCSVQYSSMLCKILSIYAVLVFCARNLAWTWGTSADCLSVNYSAVAIRGVLYSEPWMHWTCYMHFLSVGFHGWRFMQFMRFGKYKMYSKFNVIVCCYATQFYIAHTVVIYLIFMRCWWIIAHYWCLLQSIVVICCSCILWKNIWQFTNKYNWNVISEFVFLFIYFLTFKLCLGNFVINAKIIV